MPVCLYDCCLNPYQPQVVDREVKAAAPTAAGAKAITDSGKQVVAPQPSPTSATAGGVKAVDYAAALRSGTTSQVRHG